MTEHTSALALTLNNAWEWPAAWEFVSFLRAERIDVVHAHMIRAATAAVPLARLARVPVVVHTCHGREAWRKKWFKRQYWIDRRIADCSNATIAVSESTAAYLVEEKKFDPESVHVIRNGRHLNGFHPSVARQRQLRAEFGFAPDDLVVGVIGRLEEQKGHRHLLEALPAVRSQVTGVRLLFVGDGSLRASLETCVRAQGFERNVTFTGYRSDSLELMEMCDVLALPSLFEGMPLVPIEGALLGKAVVATAVDGTREVVKHGITGTLVPAAQPAALAGALLELLLDPQRRRSFGENAQARAQELFSLARQLEETGSLYENLLERSHRNRRDEVA
jgi:glycosyltransferase involved in cell wall biosynthesis